MRAPRLKTRFINWGCVAPLLAYLAVAGAIVAGAITLSRHSTDPAPMPAATPSAMPGAMPSNELLGELAHCQALGRRAEDNLRCLKAWAENRRRFFGGNPEPASPTTSGRQP